MKTQPLVIGIDFTNEYCQACYYNRHHERPESVMTGAAVLRYMIPAVMCYDEEKGDWLIGEEAMHFSEESGAYLFKDLLNGMLNGQVVEIDGEKKPIDVLTASYFRKFIELIQVHSGLSSIENITVAMRHVNLEIKEKVEGIFKMLGLGPEKLRLISYAESFAYYVLNEDEALWRDGALLFDFDSDGFFSKQMTFAGTEKAPLIYVNEKNHSMELSVKDLASELLRSELDLRLSEVFDDVKFAGPRHSVFFTGTGFSELWFSGTLEKISAGCRVFKGNNLYVKGACLAGYIRAYKNGNDYPIICRGRTKAQIALKTYFKGQPFEMEVSKAACDWYDAGSVSEYILTGEKAARFVVTSLVSRQRTIVDFDLSDFPDRPEKTTRVEVSVRYINDAECEIKLKDKGFGAFYAASGAEAVKILNLEGYI